MQDKQPLEEEVSANNLETLGLLQQPDQAHGTNGRNALLYQNSLVRSYVRTVSLILIWYVLSIFLTLFNKKLIGKEHGLFGKGAFPAPLFQTGIQFAWQHLLARATLGSCVQRAASGQKTWQDFFKRVIPNGVSTGLDIGLSNASLFFITSSFYTMCKATAPMFLLFFAFFFGVEEPSWGLVGVILTIQGGLFLLVAGETKFHPIGFVMVLTAACLSGLRWCLTQVLLQGKGGHQSYGNPLELVEALTPVMSLTVVIFSIALEQPWTLQESPYFESISHTLVSVLIIFFVGTVAFMMVWVEFRVIQETSALTMMIAGTMKEVVTVICAIIIYHDEFTWINGLGLLVVLAGVGLFNYIKLRQIQAGQLQQPATRRLKPGKVSGGEVDSLLVEMAAKRGGHAPLDSVPISTRSVSSGPQDYQNISPRQVAINVSGNLFLPPGNGQDL